MQTIALLFPLVLTNNLIMSAVKLLAAKSVGKAWLRCMLVALSFIGIIATATITGDPVDLNRINELGMLLVETLVLTIGSHLSYKAIKT